MTNRHRRNNRPPPTNPETPEEWQAAVDAAEFWIALDSARHYGLVKGGPTIDPERCAHILAKGESLGYKPASITELVIKFIERRMTR